jgi:hypothetical protein
MANMKLRDLIGNELRKGDTIVWLMPGGAKVQARIVEAIAPFTVHSQHADDGLRKPGKVVIEIAFDLNPENDRDFVFPDMIRSFDPKAEAIAAAAMGGLQQ